MQSQVLVVLGATLVGQVAARSSGHLTIVVDEHDGNKCYYATIDNVHDTKLGIEYPYSEPCRGNGSNEIASADFHCKAWGGVQDFSDIHVFAHDAVQLCCEHFHTCMSTNFKALNSTETTT